MMELFEYYQTFDNPDILCNIESNLQASSAKNTHFFELPISSCKPIDEPCIFLHALHPSQLLIPPHLNILAAPHQSSDNTNRHQATHI